MGKGYYRYLHRMEASEALQYCLNIAGIGQGQGQKYDGVQLTLEQVKKVWGT